MMLKENATTDTQDNAIFARASLFATAGSYPLEFFGKQ